MSILPRTPCPRCKSLVEAEAKRVRIDGIDEGARHISNLIAEDPGEFLRMLPADVRARLVAEARKQ